MSETVNIGGRMYRVVSSAPAKPTAAKRKAHRTIPRPLDGDPVGSGTLFLSMAPPSVNGLFFNRKKGRGKTLAYRNWQADADQQLRAQPSWHVPGRVSVAVRVGGSRADADNLLKATIDALVNAGRIEDDRNVAKAIAEHDACLGTRIEIKAVKS